MRRLLLCLTLLLTAKSLSATTGSVNLRSTPWTPGTDRYYVVFIGRGGSLSGHALVVWGHEDQAAQRTEMKGFGLYPKDPGARAYFGPVDGKIVDELNPLNPRAPLALQTDSLIAEVDAGKYNSSLKIVDAYKDRATYSLVSSDCVSFVANVATSIGLNVPGRSWTSPSTWMPQAWIRALIANSMVGGVAHFGKGIFVGTVNNHQPDGDGTVFFDDNGSRYDGLFSHGSATGGTLYMASGATWIGIIDSKGNPVGIGALTSSTGETYQGSIDGGRFSGKGRLTLPPKPYTSPDYFDGDWDSGRFVGGRVRTTLDNGHYYEGDVSVILPGVNKIEPNGRGQMSWQSPSGQESRIGDFVHGKFIGPGVFVGSLNSGRYAGEWANGKPNGKGNLTVGKVILEGNFVEGLLQGQGKEIHDDGSEFQGSFVDSIPRGKGKLITGNGTFIAEWKSGVFVTSEQVMQKATMGTFKGLGIKWDGGDLNASISPEGKQIWTGTFKDTHPPNMHYEGELNSKFLPEGQGKAEWPGYGTFNGNWVGGQPSQGDFKAANGTSFSGTIESGFLKNGTATYSDGSSYKGEFKEGEPSGQGEMRWANGSSYSGQFAGGSPDGSGTFTGADGKQLTGNFDKGSFVGHPENSGRQGHDSEHGPNERPTDERGRMVWDANGQHNEKELHGMDIEGHALN